MEPEYLNVTEAAARIRIHHRTLRRLLNDGKLPGVRVGSQWRISVASLDAFMAGQLPADSSRKTPAAEPDKLTAVKTVLTPEQKPKRKKTAGKED